MPHDILRARTRLVAWIGLAVLLVATAQIPAAQAPPGDEGGPSAAPVEPPAETATPEPPRPADALRGSGGGIEFIALMISGGAFMIPLAFMSILGVTFAIERGLALRRSRLMPEELMTQLGQLGSGQGGFDPREAFRVCQRFPCAAASVIKAMLVKIGRPHSELEHAVTEAAEREAERAYSPVRWLTLCTSVTPLMGLLGTVWGMIVAFHETTQLAPGQDRAQQLAEGIYIALVTTLAGLMVAIPSAILAHFFETRIVAVFHEIDELLFNLLPLVERFEGRVRFSQKPGEERPSAAPIGEEPAGSAAANN